jgi:hypothetical protein
MACCEMMSYTLLSCNFEKLKNTITVILNLCVTTAQQIVYFYKMRAQYQEAASQMRNIALEYYCPFH